MLCVVSTAMVLAGDKAENRDYPNPCAEPEPSNDCFEPRNTTKNNNDGHQLAIPIGDSPEKKEQATTARDDKKPEEMNRPELFNQPASNTDVQVMGPKDRLCYFATCNGQGCLYELLLGLTDPMSQTCIAVFPNVCYTSYTNNSEASTIMEEAGCGIDCQDSIVDPGAASTDEPTTVETSTKFREPLITTNRPAGAETNVVTEQSKTGSTTTMYWDFPRRRRKRSLMNPDKECCYENHCNHGSPCGELHCSAVSIFTGKMLPLLMSGFLYDISYIG